MSDHDPINNGSLFRGSDGKVQGRKVAAVICFVTGIALLILGAVQPPEVDLQGRVVPAVVALVFALLFWGLLTVQNVVQLLLLLRGKGSVPFEKGENSSTGGPQ